jgi:multidrug efflux pump subunit AcrA (membrane-fusion protein)
MSRQFSIHVIMDNQDRQVKSGMFARVLVGDSGEQTLMVPSRAVFQRGQLQGLYLVKPDNTAMLRWIRTGVENSDMVEVLSGVNAGDRIIVEGIDAVSDGQSVEVRS